ncbi:ABC transporter transmembrane region [Halomicronema hongdechloris C2206]|uniref:ABC transporter transmembrane region n=1 Tax=Halomicronema hongdechloris C2206 TaxID=1641165 RepID=A0A1Z3HMZ4_9CYAN|nr:hypothetical protein [Halomicronema hongdechloris]ASC71646.1 ABC transporter transmembrane region [Halomicronema hongdechloris C2206]
MSQAIATLRVETGSDMALQAAVWDRLLTLRMAFYRQFASGDLNSRVSSITAIRRKLSGSALQGLFAGIFSLLNLGLLVYYSPPPSPDCPGGGVRRQLGVVLQTSRLSAGPSLKTCRGRSNFPGSSLGRR